MVWVRLLEVRDLRNIRHAGLELHPGLNVFAGRNAQGKTSILEAVGFLARGRSFRTDETRGAIRRGADRLLARGAAAEPRREAALEVEVEPGRRRFRVDGREVPAREYQGRLEVVVYSTDRLRVVRGSMRDRRQFLDRGASALWPAYRQVARDFERVLAHRNVALGERRRDLAVWTEQFVDVGGRLRARRAAYVERLRSALACGRGGFSPGEERYDLRLADEHSSPDEAEQRHALGDAVARAGSAELRAGRSLVGPHRDPVAATVDGAEAAEGASAGQARSLLLALAVATLAVYREETGASAVALLDDLDSELDEERVERLCREVASGGQALVTTAHPAWVARVAGLGRVFNVSAGEVRCA